LKNITERIVFKRVDKISNKIDMDLFKDIDITIAYLHDLIQNNKIQLKDYFYEKDVSGIIHSIRDSVEFKDLMIEMIEAVKKYRKTGFLSPINKIKKTDNKYKNIKE
jgi:hypothetical protein